MGQKVVHPDLGSQEVIMVNGQVFSLFLLTLLPEKTHNNILSNSFRVRRSGELSVTLWKSKSLITWVQTPPSTGTASTNMVTSDSFTERNAHRKKH